MLHAAAHIHQLYMAISIHDSRATPAPSAVPQGAPAAAVGATVAGGAEAISSTSTWADAEFQLSSTTDGELMVQSG